MTRRRLATVAVTSAVVLGTTVTAFAAGWSAMGGGAASAKAATLTAPGKPVPNGTATTSSIPISWTAAGGVQTSAIGYWVQRATFGGTDWTSVCGSTAGSPIWATSCSDSTSITAGGKYQYQVTSVVGGWKVAGPTSAEIDAAAAAGDTTAPTVSDVSTTNKDSKLATGDTFVVTFSEPVKGLPSSTTVTEARANSSSNVTLSIPSVISGAIDLGSPSFMSSSGNNSRTATFVATVATSGSTVTVTVGTQNTGNGNGNDATAAGPANTTYTYTPATNITDLAGNAATGSKTVSNTHVF